MRSHPCILLWVLALGGCGDDTPPQQPKVPVCGDGALDDGEACDDGNAALDDGCEACTIAPIPAAPWDVTVVIGGLSDPLGIALTPKDVAVDGQGNVFIADVYRHRIWRIDSTGTLGIVAGNGADAFGGDGGPARLASLHSPTGVAVDGQGNLFVADSENHRIRRIDVTGTITTVAGTGVNNFGGDGGPATQAMLATPSGVALDAAGTLYIADTYNQRIRAVDAAGVITTVAGTGAFGYAGDNGPATSAQLYSPLGLAVTASGDLVIADSFNAVVRRVRAGVITTIAGTGILGDAGDGGPAIAATLTTPAKLAVAGDVLYIADADTHRVRRVDAAGTITTIAGTGSEAFGGDGGLATAARLAAPEGLAVDPGGAIYIADVVNFRVRRIDASGTIATVAGSGAIDDIGDRGAATAATLEFPYGVFVTPPGDIYIADSDHHRVRRVTTDGVITTVAGSGRIGDGGDGGPAVGAQVQSPIAVTVDGQGALYIAQRDRIRRVDPAGMISTLATGFAFASGVAVDSLGNVYVTDRDNHRVQRIAANGMVSIVAGTGTPGFSGDGSLATTAELQEPGGIAISGPTLYIADTRNRRIRAIDDTGIITTVAGNGNIIQGTTTGDGGPATAAPLYPYGIAVDLQGALYVADGFDYRVRKVDVAGVISTLGGTGVDGLSGDGGPATSATMGPVFDVSVDAAGNVFYVDFDAFTVRKIAAGGTITTVAGQVDAPGIGPVGQATLRDPSALVSLPDRTLIAGGQSAIVQSVRGAMLEIVAGRYRQDTPTADLARFRDGQFGAVTGIAYDAAANIVYLAETTENRIDAVTLVDPADPNTWTIAPLANDSGVAGYTDGPAHDARFRAPHGLHFDATAHLLYVADTNNHVIRAIDVTTGMVSTVAGTATLAGFAGDGATATAALLDTPRALVACGNGDLFVADTNNHRIRRIAGGTISTVLGTGEPSSDDEGLPSSAYPIDAPRGLACDAGGNLFVTSRTTVRLVSANASQVVDGSGQVDTIYGRVRDRFPASVSACLTGIGIATSGNIQIVDSCAGLLVELRPPGSAQR